MSYYAELRLARNMRNSLREVRHPWFPAIIIQIGDAEWAVRFGGQERRGFDSYGAATEFATRAVREWHA